MPIKKPLIILKQAMSCDGYLDNQVREVFSNSADLFAVQKLRASVDAILVGANTVRIDNPSLLIRENTLILERSLNRLSPQPFRVVVMGKNTISENNNVFTNDLCTTIVFLPKASNFKTTSSNVLKKEYLGETLDLSFFCNSMIEHGIRLILLEGGSNLAMQFLKEGMLDVIRFAYSSKCIGNLNATKNFIEPEFNIKNVKPRIENLGSMYALWYGLTDQGSEWTKHYMH